MSRILWHSAKPTIPSGYGTQTALMVPALKAAGHEVAISCHAGLFGSVEMWNGIKMFPHSNYAAKYGMDLIEHHAKHFKPDIIISFLDAFVLDPVVVKKLPWCAWTPVDSMPVMKRNIVPLKACRWVISPTDWGRTAIKAGGVKVSAIIPCAYSPELFYIIPKSLPELRKQLSEVIGVEIGDKFLINVVSANSGERKNFPAIFEAWKSFHRAVPNSMLFLHTDPTGYFFQGENLGDMMKAMDIDPKDGVYFPPQWEYVCGAIGPDFLNLLYNCSDVHLNACLGEGFGLPIVEAQAAGCPVIVPNFGAAAEIVTERQVSSVVNGKGVYSVPGAMQYQIDVNHLILRLRSTASETRTRSAETRATISSSVARYRIEKTLPLWNKFLATH